MPPWDNVLLPRAPNAPNYAAPLIGGQIGGMIASLPDQYFQGQQQAFQSGQQQRELALQNAFPNGLPTKNGAPDLDAITATLTKIGGAPLVMQMLPLLQKQYFGAQEIQQDRDLGILPGGQPAASSQPEQPAPRPQRLSDVPGATAPSNITGQPTSTATASTEETGGNVAKTAGQYFAESGAGEADISKLTAATAASTGTPLRPSQRMSSIQQTAATSILDNFLRTGDIAPARAPQSPPMRQASAVAMATGGGASTPPTSGASGSPAPMGAANAPETAVPGGQSRPTAPPTQTAQAGIPPPVVPQGSIMRQPVRPGAAAAGGDPAAFLVPDAVRARGVTSLQFADMMAARARQQALMGNAEGAKVLQSRAQAIYDALKQANEPTTTQKDVSSGAEAAKLKLEADQKRSAATYNGIQAASSQFERDMRPYLQLSRSILNDPSMYSGIGAERVLDFNKIKAYFGDTRAAMLQEALQKVTATSVLGQINQQRDQLMEAGGQSSRIFSQQVGLVEKAAPALTTTKGGNRFLVEVATRMGELSSDVAQQAREYLRTHNTLDTEFDQQISDHLQKKPIFTQQELARPELLGAPSAPKEVTGTREHVDAWANSMGLRPGDPIRKPDGTYAFWKGASGQGKTTVQSQQAM